MRMTRLTPLFWSLVLLTASAAVASAQEATVGGTVRDETGGALPGVSVELRRTLDAASLTTVTDREGAYRFDGVDAGEHRLMFTLINFGPARRDVDVGAPGSAGVDVVLHLALNADVTVSGKRTFANLADVANPAENVVGIATASSQGATRSDER